MAYQLYNCIIVLSTVAYDPCYSAFLREHHPLISVAFNGILGLLFPRAVGVAKLNMFHTIGVSEGSNFMRDNRT